MATVGSSMDDSRIDLVAVDLLDRPQMVGLL